MKPIPTPQQIEDRLSTENTGLRDRVLAVLEGAKKTTGLAVKVLGASDAEIARVTKELAQHWNVSAGTAAGEKVLLLSPKAVETTKDAAPGGK